MRIFSLALLLALLATSARSAVVYLKEGGSLQGTMVRSTDREIILDTAQGQVSIDLDRVEHVDYAAGGAPAPAAAPPAAPPAEYRAARWRRRREAPPEEEALFGPRRQTLSFDVGVDAPLDTISLSGTSGGGTASDGIAGPLFGVQYLYHATPQAAWGLEFHYYDREATDSPNLLPNAESHVFGNSLLMMGVLKFSLTDRGDVRPFVLLGAGAHETYTAIDAHPFGGFAWADTGTAETRRIVDDNAVGLAGSVRLGLDFGYVGPYVFSLEAGWTGLTSATYGATGQGRALGVTGVSGPINYFTFAGRWGFNF
jgi:hypothetical protein